VISKRAFVIATLRRASYRWPARTEAMRLARVERGLYKCAMCTKVHTRSNIQLDHILPVISLKGFKTWDEYIDRLLCDPEGFQVLCRPCHDAKTKGENSLRKQLTKSTRKVKLKK